jgi:ATPase subunit of ABC transporter with duplicated ATPase domains
MSSLRAQALSFCFGAVPLLEDATFHLAEGWTGVVGENGSGKTTLLELLSGARAPTKGRVERTPIEARVVLCPQRVDSLSEEIRSSAGDHYTLRGKLGLDPGALVMATHDARLAKACRCAVWRVEGGAVETASLGLPSSERGSS